MFFEMNNTIYERRLIEELIFDKNKLIKNITILQAKF